MKVVFSLKKLNTASSTRGIGVYTRELISSLQKKYPKDRIISSSEKAKEIKADLIHYPYFDPFFLTMSPNKKIPTIVTIHDLIPLRFPEHFPVGKKGKLNWFIQKLLVKRVDHIITDSISSKKDIIDYIGIKADKVSVIYLGPNKSEKVPVRMTNKILNSYKLPEKYLLYVGDINWNKNVPGLIEAFSAIKDKTLSLVLVGKVFADKPNIPEHHAVEQAILTSGKSDQIRCLGFVPSHHLSVIYSKATLYVQPSWYEGFGLPILEAMKFGCPVASSDRGSLPEIGGDAVVYFDPSKDMTTTIDKLIKSPDKLEELSALGLVQAAKFTWDNAAKHTHDIYEKVLAGRT
jgi:glycosyltransferase involved in cell wall biosynthesis